MYAKFCLPPPPYPSPYLSPPSRPSRELPHHQPVEKPTTFRTIGLSVSKMVSGIVLRANCFTPTLPLLLPSPHHRPVVHLYSSLSFWIQEYLLLKLYPPPLFSVFNFLRILKFQLFIYTVEPLFAKNFNSYYEHEMIYVNYFS